MVAAARKYYPSWYIKHRRSRGATYVLVCGTSGLPVSDGSPILDELRERSLVHISDDSDLPVMLDGLYLSEIYARKRIQIVFGA